MAEKDTLDLAALTRRVTAGVLLSKLNGEMAGKIDQHAEKVARVEAERWYRKNKSKFEKLIAHSVLLAVRQQRKTAYRRVAARIRTLSRLAIRGEYIGR